MSLFDRLILTVYSLALVLMSFFAIALIAGLIPQAFVTDRLVSFFQNGQLRLIFGLIFFLFLLVSVRFLLLGVKKEKGKEAVLLIGEHGDVQISAETLENLAHKAAKKFRSVRDVKVKIRPHEKSVTVHLKVIVDGEEAIPKLSEQLQQAVKMQIESIAGVEVMAVPIKVSNISAAQATRAVRVE